MRGDYSKVKIKQPPWPRWGENKAGPWKRTWRFKFARRRRDAEIPTEVSSVRLEGTWDADGTLTVETMTMVNPWTDEIFFFAAWDMFRELEARVGRIREINDTEKKTWLPWRKRSPSGHGGQR